MKFSPGKSVKFDCGSQHNGSGSWSIGSKMGLPEGQRASSEDSFDGLIGVFTQTKNDFTFFTAEQSKEQERHFVEDPHWNPEKRRQVKRFRFWICSLALLGMTLGVMSRFVFNIAIVEMTKTNTKLPKVDLIEQNPSTTTDLTTSEYEPTYLSEGQSGDAKLDWSVRSQNLLISAFYMGYAPSMLLSGSVAEKYGAKYPLLMAALSPALISLMTPVVARYSFTLMFLMRVLLGVLQGGLYPSMYALFNKWLTLTETSIFVPLIKVFMAFGTLFAALLPGIASRLGLDWPAIFYMASSLCIIWTLVWFPLATSTPQTNSFVKVNECQWIMRKKQPFAPGSSLSSNLKLGSTKEISTEPTDVGAQCKPTEESRSTPWLMIATNPSVLALTLVKFTYNIAMDFFALEMALYLRNVHQASTETISAIASGGALMQMSLITLVGWLASILVARRSLGLSRTKWRKVFQGSSNFIMALAYFALPFAGSNLPLVTCLILLVFLSWILGAGGESMVPYDLSSRYPATIVGLAHSFSILSGITTPILCGFVLGDDATNVQGWNLLFNFIGSAATIGGLVFCLIVKSKPFLPGEIEPNPKKDPPRKN